MRVPLQCAMLMYATTVVNGKRTVRGVAEEDNNTAGERQRYLKKGDDRGGDYYYGFERPDPKALKAGARVASKSPIASHLTRPPSSAPASADTDGPTDPSTKPSDSAPPPRKKKSDTSKKFKSKKSKLDEKSSKGSSRPSPSVSGKGKGQGKGKGEGKGKGKGEGGIMGSCSSPVADAIAEAVPQVITQNPDSCCDFDGPIAVYVTHALPSDITQSGFELFWDEIYTEIARTSSAADVCFVMTGVDSSVMVGGGKTLSDVLIQTNTFVSEITSVAAMMVTDPTTDNVDLINDIRRISDSTVLPSIGIFNAGYSNLIIESIVSGEGRLPYVGYLSDADYGTEAGKITLNLLDGVPAKPLCFNARLGVIDFVGERCAAYYVEVSNEGAVIEPDFGVACSANSTVADIVALLNEKNGNATVNAVWAPLDCCSVVAEAVASVRTATGRTIVAGCQDGDATTTRRSGEYASSSSSSAPRSRSIDFVTQQPIALQAYSTASWANFPVLQSKLGKDGRGGQYFPSLQSLVNTAIFNTVVL